MKRSRRRTILKLLLLLIAGAALNVAVAWGWVVLMPVQSLALPEAEARAVVAAHHEFDESRFDFALVIGSRRKSFGWTSIDCSIELIGLPDNWRGREIKVVKASQAGWPNNALGAIELQYSRPPIAGTYAWNLPAAIDFYPMEWRVLPTKPLWPGFAVNTLFYTGVLWVLFCGPFALRRMIRKRRGQCAACAYPIGQNERCTECGAALLPFPREGGSSEGAGSGRL